MIDRPQFSSKSYWLTLKVISHLTANVVLAFSYIIVLKVVTKTHYIVVWYPVVSVSG